MKPYDYLIVGAGLSGAMFAHAMSKQSKRCLVIEQEPYVGGFCYTENINGIECHKFGAHIFRTNSKKVWDFVNSNKNCFEKINLQLKWRKVIRKICS